MRWLGFEIASGHYVLGLTVRYGLLIPNQIYNMPPRILSKIKQQFVPAGKHPRTIRAGPFSGIRMLLDLSHQTQLLLGFHERELHRWIDKFSKGVNTAIDIGAAEGEYALFFLDKTPAKKVFAFEPSAPSRQLLMENCELNGIDGATLNLSGKFVGRDQGKNTCELDDFSSEIASPCIVKVDVDGGEADVLKGAENILAMSGVRWIVETHSFSLEQKCIEIFEANNYDVTIIDNAWWRIFIPELRPNGHCRWLVATHS